MVRLAGLVEIRVVIPVLDKTLPAIAGCMGTALCRIGGAAAFALTDDEPTVTVIA